MFLYENRDGKLRHKYTWKMYTNGKACFAITKDGNIMLNAVTLVAGNRDKAWPSRQILIDEN